MDMDQARINMVEQQIRPWDVLDQEVLDLLLDVRREEFVPEAYRKLAYADLQIPLGHGETMWEPKLEGRVLQEVAIAPTDKVLEIGTGSGYLTTLCAHEAHHVYSVEIVPDLKTKAEAALAAHGIRNATVEIGDGARGWTRHGPYDVIIVTGSLPMLPDAFQESLALGGRLFVIVGEAPVMKARLIRRVGEDAYLAADLFETCIAALQNAPQPERFVF